MTLTKSVLFIYYSLTEQTQQAVFRVRDSFEAEGLKCDTQRLVPVHDWPLPITRTDFVLKTMEAYAGRAPIMPIHPVSFDATKYDYIVFGFQPWFLQPSYPIQYFLDSHMAEVFDGKKVILLQTCRNRFEKPMDMVKQAVEKRNGTVVSGLALCNPPGHLMPTLHYLFYNRDPLPKHPLSRFITRQYGFDDLTLSLLSSYGRRLARDIKAETHMDDPRWHSVQRIDQHAFESFSPVESIDKHPSS